MSKRIDNKMTKQSKKDVSFINILFELQLNIKTFHWMTISYSKHKATDELYGDLNDKIDHFVEVYMGKYGRPNITTETVNIKNMSDEEFIMYLKNSKVYLQKILPNFFTESDTDLLNIRDEILASLNKTLYLFTLS
jgi:DNA-binding ferritin-like protein